MGVSLRQQKFETAIIERYRSIIHLSPIFFILDPKYKDIEWTTASSLWLGGREVRESMDEGK